MQFSFRNAINVCNFIHCQKPFNLCNVKYAVKSCPIRNNQLNIAASIVKHIVVRYEVIDRQGISKACSEAGIVIRPFSTHNTLSISSNRFLERLSETWLILYIVRTQVDKTILIITGIYNFTHGIVYSGLPTIFTNNAGIPNRHAPIGSTKIHLANFTIKCLCKSRNIIFRIVKMSAVPIINPIYNMTYSQICSLHRLIPPLRIEVRRFYLLQKHHHSDLRGK